MATIPLPPVGVTISDQAMRAYLEQMRSAIDSGDKNIWASFQSDSGAVAANTTTDTFQFTGGAGISTSISGDVLTITNDAVIAAGTGISVNTVGDTTTVTNSRPDWTNANEAYKNIGSNELGTAKVTGGITLLEGSDSPNKGFIVREGYIQTTDATPTVLYTITTPNEHGYQITANVLGLSANSSNVSGYVLHGTFRNDGGILTQVGTTTVTHTAEDTAGHACTLSASGINIVVTVTGSAATTINWTAGIQYLDILGA